MLHCPYLRCKFNCRSKEEHKMYYAKLRIFYNTRKSYQKKKKSPSKKVNWEKYYEIINKFDKIE